MQKVIEMHAGKISEHVAEERMAEAWTFIEEMDTLTRIMKNLDCKMVE